jgi:hypothetical protein
MLMQDVRHYVYGTLVKFVVSSISVVSEIVNCPNMKMPAQIQFGKLPQSVQILFTSKYETSKLSVTSIPYLDCPNIFLLTFEMYFIHLDHPNDS